MRLRYFIFIFGLVFIIGSIFVFHKSFVHQEEMIVPAKYWLRLARTSQTETLYKGTPGDANHSQIIRVFQVKTGIDGKSPTPLPRLMGREYWKIIKKESSSDNPDTAPYFLTLDIPSGIDWPYGPTPYEECIDPVSGENAQCDWVQPGFFGLHGVAGNEDKLSSENEGSLGCIRHKDEDITYLYELLDPENEEIRYYVDES